MLVDEEVCVSNGYWTGQRLHVSASWRARRAHENRFVTFGLIVTDLPERCYSLKGFVNEPKDVEYLQAMPSRDAGASVRAMASLYLEAKNVAVNEVPADT